MIATITTCPSTMAVTAVIAAGWRKICKIGRDSPRGMASGYSFATSRPTSRGSVDVRRGQRDGWKIDLGSIAWAPLMMLTSWVIRRSTARLHRAYASSRASPRRPQCSSRSVATYGTRWEGYSRPTRSCSSRMASRPCARSISRKRGATETVSTTRRGPSSSRATRASTASRTVVGRTRSPARHGDRPGHPRLLRHGRPEIRSLGCGELHLPRGRWKRGSRRVGEPSGRVRGSGRASRGAHGTRGVSAAVDVGRRRRPAGRERFRSRGRESRPFSARLRHDRQRWPRLTRSHPPYGRLA